MAVNTKSIFSLGISVLLTIHWILLLYEPLTKKIIRVSKWLEFYYIYITNITYLIKFLTFTLNYFMQVTPVQDYA